MSKNAEKICQGLAFMQEYEYPGSKITVGRDGEFWSVDKFLAELKAGRDPLGGRSLARAKIRGGWSNIGAAKGFGGHFVHGGGGPAEWALGYLFEDVNFVSITFEDLDFRGVSFEGCWFSECRFFRCAFGQVMCQDGTARSGGFKGCSFTQSFMRRAYGLAATPFSECKFRDCVFEGGKVYIDGHGLKPNPGALGPRKPWRPKETMDSPRPNIGKQEAAVWRIIRHGFGRGLDWPRLNLILAYAEGRSMDSISEPPLLGMEFLKTDLGPRAKGLKELLARMERKGLLRKAPAGSAFGYEAGGNGKGLASLGDKGEALVDRSTEAFCREPDGKRLADVFRFRDPWRWSERDGRLNMAGFFTTFDLSPDRGAAEAWEFDEETRARMEENLARDQKESMARGEQIMAERKEKSGLP